MSRFLLFVLVYSISHTLFALDWDKKSELSLTSFRFSKNISNTDQTYHHLMYNGDLSIHRGNNFDFNLSPRFQYQTSTFKEDKKFQHDFRELNLTFNSQKSTTQIGYFNLTKEGPDLFNPIDHVQPKNYNNPLDIQTYALLGLKWDYAPLNNLNLTLAYVPQNRLSTLPGTHSRWYPRENNLPLNNDFAKANLTFPVEYTISKNSAEHESDLQNNFIFSTKMNLNSSDIFLQYDELISNTPDITPVLTGTLISTTPITEIQLDNPIDLQVVWKKNKNYSAGINRSFEQIQTLIKLYYNRQIAPLVSTDWSVLAIEKQFAQSVLIIEYSHQDRSEKVAAQTTSGLTQIFKNTYGIGLRSAFSDNLSFLLGALNEADRGSQALYFKPKYQWNDHIYTEAQFVFFSGRKDSLLWIYDNNDIASLKLGALF